MTKHVAFSKPGDEMGEPSVEFYLYDYCDEQSVVSEAPSIDLGLLQEQQQQEKNIRANMAKISRGHDRGMGKLLKQHNQIRRSSLVSEMSNDGSMAENSFWDNEENSFADYAQFGGGGSGNKAPTRNGSLRISQQKRMSISSDSGDSFWNNEENSFADYMQFGAQNLPSRRMSASQRSGSIRLSELKFDHDEASLADSVLSMGSFALDGDLEVEGWEEMIQQQEQQLRASANYKSTSKAAMMDFTSTDESWSSGESVLKGENDVSEEDLNDVMPNSQSAGMMRRAERRAQRARDRLSAYSRTPSRNGSIGSISSNIPRRNGSLGKYSDHSLGSISLSSGPRRNGSLGKYSDHSLPSSSGVVNIPRRSGSLGKYSDHSGRSNRRAAAAGNPRRTGSIGAPIRSQSAHGAVNNSSSSHSGRRSAGPGHRRVGSMGKAHSAKALGSNTTDTITDTIAEVDSPPPTSDNKKKIDDEVGSPTLRQRNGKGSKKKNDDDNDGEIQSPTARQRKNATKNIVSPRVSNAMNKKLLGSGAVDLPNSGASLLAGTIKRKNSKLKVGKDSDNLPRSANLRQQLLG